MIKLKLNPKNPRRINDQEFEKLKDKIRKFPDMLEKRPIVYDENKTILGGNMRYRALQVLENEGLEIKDSYFIDASGWSEEQKKFFIINDNLSDGSWDYDILANEWDLELLQDWGLNMGSWQTDNIDVNKEWEGMPEFDGVESISAHRSIIVHFESAIDVDKFSTLVKQTITDKTKSIWYPRKDRENNIDFKVITDES